MARGSRMPHVSFKVLRFCGTWAETEMDRMDGEGRGEMPRSCPRSPLPFGDVHISPHCFQEVCGVCSSML